MGPRRTHNSLMTACLSPSPYGESDAWRVRAASCALRSVCGGITTHRGRHGFLATLLLLLLMAANAPGANAAAGAPALVANALLPAPGTRHSFVRVNVPGTESELDFVAIGADASLVKGLPALGWIDASAARANTKAAPLLTIAGAVCLPAFINDPADPAMKVILALREITAVPSLAFVARCADACDSLGLFDIPQRHAMDWEAHLSKALARTPKGLHALLHDYISSTPCVCSSLGATRDRR